MNPVSIYPAIAALTIALSISFLFVKRIGAPPISGRFVSIDGLRGYLAFFVFLCHSSVWYFFLRTGRWEVPPSHLYTHFGQSSVVFFFMITGFLFWTKLIDGRNKQINWSRLYVSRILRLAPLYFFMLLLLTILTAVLTNFVLNEPLNKLIMEIIKWSTFTILGAPDLNGMNGTRLLIASVTWSLRYEWFFYLSLPISAVLIRVIPPYLYLFVSVASIVALVLSHPDLHRLAAFGGGISAAFLVRWSSFTSFLNGSVGAVIALLCIGATISIFPSAYTPPALFLLAIVFTIVACGNTLFGVLSSPISRSLGEIAYSIYLLHGIVLFVAFKFVIGFHNAASLSAIEHWLIVLCCSAVLIPVCFITFHWIEAPAMRAVPSVSGWIETRITLRAKGRAVL